MLLFKEPLFLYTANRHLLLTKFILNLIADCLIRSLREWIFIRLTMQHTFAITN